MAICAVWIFMLPVYFLLPVYTDEIVWKALQGRLLVDEMKNMTVLAAPNCGDYLFDIPVALLPFLMFDTVLYFASSPMWIRGTGIVIYAIWMLLSVYMIARLRQFKLIRTWIVLLIFCSLMLGNMSFLMVLNRPEKMLLVLLTSAFFIAMSADFISKSKGWIFQVVVIVLAAWAFAIHPKAIFFVPFFLLSVFLVPGNGKVAIALGVLLVGTATWAYTSWDQRLSCEADVEFSTIVLPRNAFEMLVSGDFLHYAKTVWWEFNRSPLSFTYLAPIFFISNYTSDWLPQATLIDNWQITANVTIAIALFCILTAIVFSLYVLTRRLGWAVLRVREFSLFVAICIALLAINVVQPLKHDYDSALTFPMIIFGMMALVAALMRHDISLIFNNKFRAASSIVIVGILVGAVFSQFAIVTRFGPHAVSDWRDIGYLSGQRNSISSVTSSAENDKIMGAAKMCGISSDDDSKHVVVDDLTYAAFAATREPYFINYITGGLGRGIPDLERFLRTRQSSGIIVGCHLLPPDFRTRAQRTDAYCCLGAFR